LGGHPTFPPPHTISFQYVLPADNVRGKFIAILTAVATDVALKRLAEAVAAHVDGEHDVVQEEHAAVLAAEGPHGPPLSVHHPEGLPGGGGRRRGRAGGRGLREGSRVGARVASLLPLPVFGVAGARPSPSPVVQQESGRRDAAAVVEEVVVVVVVVIVVKVQRRSATAAASVRLVLHTLRVRGVLAAVAGRGRVAAPR